MSATRKQDVTHDVGNRISWNNRPPVSIRPEVSDQKYGLKSASIKWEERRDNMKDVCFACHGENWVENFYTQYDALVNLYNEKYARPGLRLMEAAKPLLKPSKFSNKIDWTWFELWHHEGRRARHAASMMGPDYTHWHGTYDLAKHWYSKFIPQLEELIKKGKAAGGDKATAAANLQAELDAMLNSDDHKWYLDKLSDAQKEMRKAAVNRFKEQMDGKVGTSR